MNDLILKADKLNVKFSGANVIRDLSFEIKKGTMTAIVGPNGAGKTVLFRALLGLIDYEGEVLWQKDAKIGYVPQHLAIERDLPLSVYEFFKFKTNSDEKIYDVLRAVGFKGDEHHLKHRVLSSLLGTLSGGELQRILIGWSMLGEPDVLLFDEPTSGIDIGGEETIYHFLHELHKKYDLTIIFITHDLHIVYEYADLVVCLNKTMICSGQPQQALSSETLIKLFGPSSVYAHAHKEF